MKSSLTRSHFLKEDSQNVWIKISKDWINWTTVIYKSKFQAHINKQYKTNVENMINHHQGLFMPLLIFSIISSLYFSQGTFETTCGEYPPFSCNNTASFNRDSFNKGFLFGVASGTYFISVFNTRHNCFPCNHKQTKATSI